MLIGARRAQTELDSLLGVGPHLAPRARGALGRVPARHHRRRTRPCAGSARTPRRAWRCRRCSTARKAAILDAARRGLITDRTAGAHVAALDEQILRARRRGSTRRRGRTSDMKIVIVGAGRAGLEVAMHLTRIGHAVTIIDSDEAVTRRASEQHGLVALSGDATIAAVLEEADIAQSDVVVAMLRRDADNLAVALLARAAGVDARDGADARQRLSPGLRRGRHRSRAVGNRSDHRVDRHGDRARSHPARDAARRRQRHRLRADHSRRQRRGRARPSWSWRRCRASRRRACSPRSIRRTAAWRRRAGRRWCRWARPCCWCRRRSTWPRRCRR